MAASIGILQDMASGVPASWSRMLISHCDVTPGGSNFQFYAKNIVIDHREISFGAKF